jgi:ABC-type sugar transport system ATPase subunit
MVGRDVTETYPQRSTVPGEAVLELSHLSGNGDHDISLCLHQGEILGLAGLVGAGRTELGKLIVGAAKIEGGSIKVNGKNAHIHSPASAMKHSIGIIPEDRKREGAFLEQSVQWNINIMALRRSARFSFVNNKLLRKSALEMRELFDIKTPSMEQLVRNLSGGNQQKTVLAKVLAADTRIVIFDEPTRGIDVGVKQDFYRLMNELTARGVSILMISSEMEELVGMCDRIIVLYKGRIAGELKHDEFDQTKILEYASGSAYGARGENV